MDTPTYTNPNQSLGFLLHQAAINWRRSLAKELRAINVTPVQFFMLGSTSRLTGQFGQGPMQRDIAENTLIDINVVSQVVRQLETRGLLLRERDTADKRAFRLVLSEDGRQTLRKAIQIVRRIDEEFFAPIMHKATLAEELSAIM